MKKITDEQIENYLIGTMSDGLNRSLNALKDAGAIDTKKLHEKYEGIGSEYYDIVTEQLEFTAKIAAPRLREIITEIVNEDCN